VSGGENPHAGQGPVVLDIGDDVGALVVTTPAGLRGAELEICPAGRRAGMPDEGGDWWPGEWRSHPHPHPHSGPGHRHPHPAGPSWPHVAVLRRPAGSGPEWAAVFPALREGAYDIWQRPAGETALTVTVTGGAVTVARWP
jgi:hypothetical protein